MRHKTNYPAFAVETWKSFSILLIILVTSYPMRLGAQELRSFRANGKNIEVAAFNEEIEKILTETGIPAVSLAVIDDNKVVFSGTYGYKQLSEKNRVDDETVFEACSLSKTFLVFVAHQLVDEGKLQLDTPVYKYLELEALAYDPRYKLITPRMILSHTSGIENWKWFNNGEKLEILSNPGEKYVYSGEGYNYLANAIGVILKQSYEEYINERIMRPLQLKGTYLKFKPDSLNPDHKVSPWNYAIGHNSFGGEVDKWISFDPIPSSGYQITAKDYAALLVSFFDKKNLSARQLAEMVKPVVRLGTAHSSSHYGLGFEVIHSGNDTLIAHGGSNDGFKANVFYSVVHKRGFVFFTNSDRGKLITKKLSEMTAGINLEDYYKQDYYEQYPSAAIHLLRIYREKDEPALFTEIEKLKSSKKIGVNTLNELGDEFMYHDKEIAKKLLRQNIRLYPKSPTAYNLLGRLHMEANEYEAAHKNFLKAKELHPDDGEIASNLEACENKIREEAKRKSLVVAISANASMLEAENYNAMKGIRLQETSDAGGGQHVGYIDNDDWMDYKINVQEPGNYSVAFRVASLNGGGLLQVRSGTKVLATVEVGATHGWSNWTTLTTNLYLKSGVHTLHCNAVAGGFSVNWLRFTALEANKQ